MKRTCVEILARFVFLVCCLDCFPPKTSPPLPIVSSPRPSSVHRNRLVPLNSDDFLTTGFRPGFRRKNSDQFLSVSLISNEIQSKLSGIQRSRAKISGMHRIFHRKSKKTIDSDSRNNGPGIANCSLSSYFLNLEY